MLFPLCGPARRELCSCRAVSVSQVLGVMAMIDEGETDWKVIGIDVNDPLAEKINDIDDVDKHMPGQLAVRTRRLCFNV